jgi:hypothetical protein
MQPFWRRASRLATERTLDDFKQRITRARYAAQHAGHDPNDKISVEMLATGEQKQIPVWCWYLDK